MISKNHFETAPSEWVYLGGTDGIYNATFDQTSFLQRA